MEDFSFSISGLENRTLFIEGVETCDFFVIDGDGMVCFPLMRPATRNGKDGTEVVFENYSGSSDTFRIKFVANAKGVSKDEGSSRADFYFNESNLVDGKLFIEGVEPGDFFVIDDQGMICFPNMKPGVMNGGAGTIISIGTALDGSGDYRIKFINGKSSTSLIRGMYASSENGGWHDQLAEDDSYMKMSSDGGATWTKPISLGSTSSSGGQSSSDDYTGEYIHNFIVPISSGSTAIDTIVNEMVLPEMWMFCEIMAHYETAQKASDGNFHFTYHHWNKAYTPQVFLNGSDVQLNSSLYEINYVEGYIIPKWEVSPADNLICTYNFTWFKPETLISFVKRAVGVINYRGTGQTTNYTIDTLPESWYGIDADLVVAMMCEHLILAQTMWYGKLIFAITASDLYNGGGGVGSDIASTLESMKRNAEDRAYSQIDNEKLRAPAYLAKPTPAYWRAVTMGNGIRPGPHGQWSYGKTRGMRFNRMVGMTGPDLGI